MKLGVLVVVLLCSSMAFASIGKNQLVVDVIEQSGLQEKILKENFGDIVELEKALLRASSVEGDAKDYLKAVKHSILPVISKTENKSVQNHQYAIVQYNILQIAGAFGY